MPRLRAAAKKRKEDLQRKVQLKLQAKANRKEQQEQKAINTRMKASREVFRFGGPWTLNEVSVKLNQLDAVAARQALLAQLRFHRDVLHSKGEKMLFNESRHGVVHSLDILESHLREVLELNGDSTEEVEAAEDVLIYRDLTDVDEDVRQRKSDVIQRLEKGRKRRLATQAKESLPLLEASPSDLVGRRVLHQCSEDGGAPQWYPGVVGPIAKHSVHPHRVLFQISSDVCTSSAFFGARC
ncbi:hypothetical protein CAPTEDRAFT_202500 [Capitella teleta]|uniref:Uncharacterized protein n=1 Tax=Capitella teleta TaxID=283909 RepID=R7UI71_CAPTE|nr:hypothetical protein CAPTEDRAFT_202500 [Capitella teleta]|eukprot:ELU05803.1 hypothetical protein CAPTEDRAFT_202500 [Capitella teleta]